MLNVAEMLQKQNTYMRKCILAVKKSTGERVFMFYIQLHCLTPAGWSPTKLKTSFLTVQQNSNNKNFSFSGENEKSSSLADTFIYPVVKVVREFLMKEGNQTSLFQPPSSNQI